MTLLANGDGAAPEVVVVEGQEVAEYQSTTVRAGCRVAQSLKQGRLPDTWLANHRGGSAPALYDACQQVLEEGQLLVTTT